MGAKDKAKNVGQDLKGKAKEAMGEATGDRAWRPRARPTRARPRSSRPARRSRTRSSA